jgi:alpha/beta superfamily hydrolase
MTIMDKVCATSDGVTLEAEFALPATMPPRAGVVLCHPHPQFGGTMRSIVISALFEALPRQQIACLRFNFRGVENSGGTYGEGRSEPLDVLAAIEVLAEELHPAVPLTLVGWSFGADMALSVDDSRVQSWVAIAPPLRFSDAFDAAAHDGREKLLVLAEHDEFRPPGEVIESTACWTNTECVVIAGASHFFVGRTDQVVDATTQFLLERTPG